MKSPTGNNTAEDTIVIEDDESPVAMIEDNLANMIGVNLDEQSSSSRPPQSKGEIEALDYLSAEIGFMEYGKELWKVVHRLILRSYLEELMQLPELLDRTAAKLTAFTVLEAYKLKGIMEDLSQMVGEILKLEGLISPILNPSIDPLLDFYSDQPSILVIPKASWRT
ncbi:hypothetical protein AMTR_s00028p00214700 [Amborella trichopoda]|uniref:Uncharacterized protein n=1 Tax=Amborella trichopoda TaxID=13333 RepID=W1PS47_AMBTC|nr:hypothetical protein AMTR_s00028p00214700 [Amborella trichopoda]